MKASDFNNEFYKFSTEVNAYDRSRVEKIVEMTGSGKVVLDIGCMDGTLGALIKSQGNTVHGIDISEAAVKLACDRGILAKVGDIEGRLDFPDGFFDVVVAGEVIEHLYDTDHLLEEVHRALKPQGRLILTTPNIATLSRRLKFLRGRDPGLEYSVRHESSVGHIRFFLKSTLEDLLRRNHFRVERMRSDFFQFGGIKSRKLGDWLPSLGKRFVVEAAPVK